MAKQMYKPRLLCWRVGGSGAERGSGGLGGGGGAWCCVVVVVLPAVSNGRYCYLLLLFWVLLFGVRA